MSPAPLSEPHHSLSTYSEPLLPPRRPVSESQSEDRMVGGEQQWDIRNTWACSRSTLESTPESEATRLRTSFSNLFTMMKGNDDALHTHWLFFGLRSCFKTFPNADYNNIYSKYEHTLCATFDIWHFEESSTSSGFQVKSKVARIKGGHLHFVQQFQYCAKLCETNARYHNSKRKKLSWNNM